MPIKAQNLRIAPRVLANQYANSRCDLLLVQQKFTDILLQIADPKQRNLGAAIRAIADVPEEARKAFDEAKDAAKTWTMLGKITRSPREHYKAALNRAVRQLTGTRDPEKQKRLAAYKQLLSGGADPDLAKVEDLLEDAVNKLTTAFKKHKDKKGQAKEQVGAALLGALDTNGDGVVDDEEVDDFIGLLEENGLGYYAQNGNFRINSHEDHFDTIDQGDFPLAYNTKNESLLLDHRDLFISGAEDDDCEGEECEDEEEVGRGGRGGGGGRGGRGGRGGYRTVRVPGGPHRRPRYYGPTVVNYSSNWDLPEDDLVEDSDGNVVVRRRRPIIVRRIVR